VAPLSSATLVGSADFRVMQDNGDGTYSLRLSTGNTTGNIIVSVLTNPVPAIATPEQFTFAIN